MVTGHVFIAISLDGFIAREDGAIDWLTRFETGDEDHGYDAFIASVDGLVMGRGSFEMAARFDVWPYDKPVIVMSRTLTDADIPPALRSRVRLSRLAPAALFAALAAEGWSRAYVDGGRVIQSFLRAGLIADLCITHVPVLIGAGRRLFAELPADIALDHVRTRAFPSGLVNSEYRLA